MTRSSMLVAGVLLAVAASALGCGGGSDGSGGAGSSGGAGTTGGAGTGGGSAGATGAAGSTGTAGASGNAGGSGSFMATAPCTSEVNYVGELKEVGFGTFGGTVAYDPKCLKVAAGTEVTFKGDFSMHPLEPSTMRGTTAGNPITPVASGNAKAFMFSTPGFYAYFCETHGPSDTGTGMAGVIWVE